MSELRRGDIWLVDLEPTIGCEINKTRPAVIIQNDVGNQYNQITIIAPVSSNLAKIYPIHVKIEAKKTGIDQDSKVCLNHIRAIDKRRLIKKLGMVDSETMGLIDEAIKISLGLVPLN